MAIHVRTPVLSFVPALLRRELRDTPDWSRVPAERRFEGVVLFADISGFTALAARLARRGPEGAEILSNVLNGYFEPQLDVIAGYGGEATKFAGDATIALWPASGPAGMTAAARAAAACGLELQKLAARDVRGADEPLRLRVGIASGPLWTGRVGGNADRWEYLVAGQPVSEMGRAAASGEPGDVVVTPEVAAALGSEAQQNAAGNGYVRVRALANVDRVPVIDPGHEDEIDHHAVRPFIGRAVLRRLDAGHSDWLAEFRHLTVLFVNLGTLDFSAADILSRVQAATRAVQEAVYRFDGSVNQFITDDKGTSFVIGWGLPLMAQEDDAVRGVKVALALQDSLSALGLSPSFGLATGDAFCGLRGSWRRREYAMVGVPVNRSARLMQAAGSGALCDRQTADEARGRIQFGDEARIQLKGLAEPVAAFRPIAAAAGSARRFATLVGRTSECAAIDSCLDDLRERGAGGVVVLEGEPGIGKSALLAYLRTGAQTRGIRTRAGAADAVESATPYFVWRSVFRELLEPARHPAELEAELRRRLLDDRTLSEWAPLASTVLAIDIDENETTRDMTSEARAENTRRVLQHLLERDAARTPLLVVLDDAHWFDSATWAMTAAALRVPHLLLVMATRPLPEPVPLEAGLVLRAAGSHRLLLQPLGEDDALQIAARQLGVDGLHPSIVRYIHRKAGGNPFFSEQLALALRDGGHLRVSNGRCEPAVAGADLDTVDLPNTLEGVVTGRVDRLEPGEQLTLKVASVLGRQFRADTLRDVYPVESDLARLSDHLRVLNDRDLIQLEIPGPEPTYLFKHVVLQDVVYGLMTFGQRRDLHRSLGRWYETRHADNLEPLLSLLAHHWKQAADHPKAVEYLERAGRQAFDASANNEVVRLLNDAQQQSAEGGLAIDNVRRARWQWWIGSAKIKLTQYVPGGEHIEEGLRLLGSPPPGGRAALVASLMGQLALQVAHRLRPHAFLAPDTERESEILAVRLYHRLLEVTYQQRDILSWVAGAVRCLNVSERAGRSPELGVTYAIAGYGIGLFGFEQLARYYIAKGQDIAAEGNDAPSIGYFHMSAGVYFTGVARWPESESHITAAARLYDRTGDRFRWQTASAVHAFQYFHRAEYERMFEITDTILASRDADTAPAVLIWAFGPRLWASVIRGPVDEAALSEMERALRHPLDPVAEIYGLGCVARARLERGELAAARVAADKGLDLAIKYPPAPYYATSGLLGLGDTLLDLLKRALEAGEDPTELQAKSRLACRALRRFAMTIPLGRAGASLAEGRLARLCGKSRRAAAAFRRSAAAAEQMGLPYEAARARGELSALGS
jgi:class 3 adenylate cyclase